MAKTHTAKRIQSLKLPLLGGKLCLHSSYKLTSDRQLPITNYQLPMTNDSYKGDILAIDDTPANLRLLVGILTQQGYKVLAVPSGKLALLGIRQSLPDLILLDIMMPQMDGYEVCTHLKSDEVTRDIPVIFISAKDDVLDKVKAFAVGGVDYITKPFQVEEVLARVETHLALQRLQKIVQTQNQ